MEARYAIRPTKTGPCLCYPILEDAENGDIIAWRCPVFKGWLTHSLRLTGPLRQKLGCEVMLGVLPDALARTEDAPMADDLAGMCKERGFAVSMFRKAIQALRLPTHCGNHWCAADRRRLHRELLDEMTEPALRPFSVVA